MEDSLKKKVGIQGVSGSYHEIAAIFHFGIDNISTCPFETFSGLVESVEKKEIDFGLMAIENTVAGSLMPNYSLLMDGDVFIAGEVRLRIEHNLLALEGQTIEDIKEVYSHPMALMQCKKFFKQYPHIKLIESDDTANSARKIQQENLMGVGAVASSRAAGLFGLNNIAPGIETNKRNFTRFLVLKKKNGEMHNGDLKDKSNKVSISFSVKHETGCLSNVLSIFSFYNINLSKIQSIPIIGKEWQYHFLVDFTFEDYTSYTQSLVAIEPLTDELKVLGEYMRAENYYYSNDLTSDVNVEIKNY